MSVEVDIHRSSAARTGDGATPLDGDDAGPQGVAETDGRKRRRERNRDAVVDALLDLYRQGNLRPSTDEIADRAGLSPRSLFRYFEDTDDLTGAALSRQLARSLPYLPIGAFGEDDVVDRVRALVDQRFGLFEHVGQAATVSRLRAPFHPLVARGLSQHRAYLRDQVRRLFSPELDAMGPGPSEGALAAADVLTSFEAHQLLIHDQQLDDPTARSAMTSALCAVLGVHRLPPHR